MTPMERAKTDLNPLLEQQHRHGNRVRVAVGLGFIATGMAATAALAGDAFGGDRFDHAMPFSETAQEVVNNVDNGLGVAGEVLLPTGLLTIGALKLGAGRSARLRNIEKRSSQEAASDGHSSNSMYHRTLRTFAAGTMPVAVATGAAIGTLTTGIGAEITDGPSRPIVAFDSFAPGNTMITQYDGAMPMVESSLTAQLTEKIEAEAKKRSIAATAFQWGLNVGEHGNASFTALTLGVERSRLPGELHGGDDCGADIPTLIDESAKLKVGDRFEINGATAVVVGETHDFSAIGREGIVMDETALERCVNKDQEVNSHAVVLDTDPQTAKDILATANTNHEAATVITKEHYIKNSQDFWEGNSKPLTNTLALVGVFAGFIASGGYVLSRMLKNRTQLASRDASGESTARFRATEVVRGIKDGLIGSTVGVVAATPLTLGVNMLQTGLRVGVGIHEVMVGYGVGMLATVGGTLFHVMRSKKIIDPSEHTR